MNMKTLYLSWQTKDQRLWYPVGRLDVLVEQEWYVFRYIKGVKNSRSDKFLSIVRISEFGKSVFFPQAIFDFRKSNHRFQSSRPRKISAEFGAD